MKLEKTFLQSKLARRTFWLFVLCALLPIIALAAIALRDVTAQFKEQNKRELHQASREEAMSVFGRLSFLEANLKQVAHDRRGVQGDRARGLEEEEGRSYAEMKSRFEGLTLSMPGGAQQELYGKEEPRLEEST